MVQTFTVNSQGTHGNAYRLAEDLAIESFEEL